MTFYAFWDVLTHSLRSWKLKCDYLHSAKVDPFPSSRYKYCATFCCGSMCALFRLKTWRPRDKAWSTVWWELSSSIITRFPINVLKAIWLFLENVYLSMCLHIRGKNVAKSVTQIYTQNFMKFYILMHSDIPCCLLKILWKSLKIWCCCIAYPRVFWDSLNMASIAWN